ncbi:4Fe-4S dicluster domain-containing protein [Helicobacter sp. 11S02596-1]|uniref:4Fe-4S dicluster domain-containing protein n=1 Tax=Helicobacter sp. 11S02596-1 TaxID=1476194 RepID=UPI000BA5256C|nr:4Fe-4S dicluster domain-containing protein [Helicobacter sp. 11S02596-1]PAF43600.1 hypothetical protein BJI48_04925 [Helicobacter sp. 11S02596-1]
MGGKQVDFCDFLFVNNDKQFEPIANATQDWLVVSPSADAYALISNNPTNCDIYAPEINWYLKNSQAPIAAKAQNIKRMYFSRMERYEYGIDKSFSTEVSPTLLIIGDNTEAKEFLNFVQNYTQVHYEVGLLDAKNIISISGSLGAFEAQVKIGEEVGKISFAQGVIFYEDDDLARSKGIEKASDFEDENALLALLDSRIGVYDYKTIITYDNQNCQYHHRRPNKNNEGYCHKCANVCPTFGITKDNALMELNFSAIDCINCGNCVAVCPSGSIDYTPFSMQAFSQTLKHYQDTHILLIPEAFLDELADFEIPKHLSPLIIDGKDFLSEAHILALLQESGGSCVYYCPEISQPSQEAIKLVNDIYQQIYQKIGFHTAKNISELHHIAPSLQKIESYSYHPRAGEYKRKHFAERLRFAIKDNDYGQVKSGESGELIRYGQITLKEELCTLCMSCVGACNVGSLSANATNFSLQFNPSICTTCGYCVDSCPENAISLELSGINLHPSWFENKIIAQDKLFACSECGKEFATQKSIQKVKSIMIPLFGNDEAKIKTLECCPECKVKIMLG